MVNWRSEVKTPLRLNGRTMRSEVDAVDRIEVDDPVRMGDDPAEPHALAGEIGAHVLAGRAGLPDRGSADRLKVRRHLAGQELHQPGARQRNGVPLARERGVHVVELSALETLGDEHVGDIVT